MIYHSQIEVAPIRKEIPMYYTAFVPKEGILALLQKASLPHREELEEGITQLPILPMDTVILHHWKKDPDIVIDCRIYLTKGQSEKFLRRSSVLGLIAQQEDAAQAEALRKAIEELPTISISEQAIEERLSTVTVTTRGKDYEHKQDYLWLMDEDDMAPALIRTANAHLADSPHEA